MTVVEALELVRELDPDAPLDVQVRAAGLVLADDTEPGIHRVRRGKGFSFHRPDGTVLDGAERERCLALAVPPAWTEVWICPDADGHLQAVGRDDAGRKQYRYHDGFRALREAVKFTTLRRFGEALPRIRARVDADLRRHNPDRDRVLALTIALLDELLLRVGNEDYADDEGGHGLTTLDGDHVDVGTTVAEFSFLGKSGVEQEVVLRDRRLVRHLDLMLEADQPQLLAWQRDDGSWRDVRAEDVNEHLRDVAGTNVSAKDFRTWGGTVTALAHLRDVEPADDESAHDRQLLAAVDAAADALGNTRAVARASYVHPLVLHGHGTGAITAAYDDDDGVVDHLTPDERALLRLIEE